MAGTSPAMTKVPTYIHFICDSPPPQAGEGAQSLRGRHSTSTHHALAAKRRRKSGDDLDEVVLSVHDFLDVLVSTGNFVDDSLVLTALDASGLLFQVIDREFRFRFGGRESSRWYRG